MECTVHILSKFVAVLASELLLIDLREIVRYFLPHRCVWEGGAPPWAHNPCVCLQTFDLFSSFGIDFEVVLLVLLVVLSLLLLPQPHSHTHMKFWLCSNYKSCFRHIAPKFEFYVLSLFHSHKWSTFIYLFLLDAKPALPHSLAFVFVSLGHIHVAKTLNGKSYARIMCRCVCVLGEI